MVAVVFKKQRRLVCLFCICVSLSEIFHERKAVDVQIAGGGADPNGEVTAPQVVHPEVKRIILDRSNDRQRVGEPESERQ